MVNWSRIFAEALPYVSFLDKYANAAQRDRWQIMHSRASLAADQKVLLAGFSRRMPVLCLAGTWCGDCINQCPVFDHFSKASAQIELRFLDRDANAEIRSLLAINGGHRVPVLVFLSEDWFEVSRFGERPLSTYRRIAGEQFGPACPTGLMPSPAEAMSVLITDWLNEFERCQLILRLSPRLRARYGD
jgi:thiol-disulfide isomerase/thioredoxin